MSKVEYYVQRKLISEDETSREEKFYYSLYDIFKTEITNAREELLKKETPSRFNSQANKKIAELGGKISGLERALYLLQKREIKRRFEKKFTEENCELKAMKGLFKVYLSDGVDNSYYYVIEGKTEEEAIINFYKENKESCHRQIAAIAPLECMMPKTSIRGDKEK